MSESKTIIPKTSLKQIMNSTILKPTSYDKFTPKKYKKVYTNCIQKSFKKFLYWKFGQYLNLI